MSSGRSHCCRSKTRAVHAAALRKRDLAQGIEQAVAVARVTKNRGHRPACQSEVRQPRQDLRDDRPRLGVLPEPHQRGRENGLSQHVRLASSAFAQRHQRFRVALQQVKRDAPDHGQHGAIEWVQPDVVALDAQCAFRLAGESQDE